MKNKTSQLLFPVVLTFCVNLTYSQTQPAQPTATPQPTSIPGAQSEVYKTIGETKLMLHIFQPVGRKDGERRPAIVFFFGGGWMSGTVNQFMPQSKYLAERGMVAVLADYRVYSRHGVTPFECVADAKSAVRWLRSHATDYGIDDQRIVVAGGSSGGHLAASVAVLRGFDEKNEDLKVSSAPNALVLFNPALDMSMLTHAPADVVARTGNWLKGDWVKRVAEISPILNVRKGTPPTIIFHGTGDEAVPFAQATHFCKVMKEQGNRCEVIPFEGRPHGFFNYRDGTNPDYRETLRKTDEFLISIGYLKGEPTIQINGVKSLQVRDEDSIDIFEVEIDPISAKISSKPTKISQDFPGRSMYPRFFENGKMLSYVVTALGGYRNQGVDARIPLVVRSYPKGKDQVVPLDIVSGGMTWTPDDTLIVSGVPKGGTTSGYYRVDRKTGKSTLLLASDAPEGRVNGLSALGIPEFGLDGKMYYRDDLRHAVIVRNNQTGAERVLYQQSGPVFPILRGVHPSPNGEWVAFIESFIESRPGMNSLKVVSTSGGAARELTSARLPDWISRTPGAVWMTDSRRILFVRGRGSSLELWSVTIDGGPPQPTGLAMEGLCHPFVHPNGKTLVFAAGPGYPRN